MKRLDRTEPFAPLAVGDHVWHATTDRSGTITGMNRSTLTLRLDDGQQVVVPRSQWAYQPTPKQIAQACERIRAAWSPEERDLRFGAQQVSKNCEVQYLTILGDRD